MKFYFSIWWIYRSGAGSFGFKAKILELSLNFKNKDVIDLKNMWCLSSKTLYWLKHYFYFS